MITHQVSTIQVFMTEKYEQFRMLQGNRPLNQKKIKKIITEIESGNDMLKYYPVQVRIEDEKMLILDGQHRFFISSKLKRPVYYIIVSEQKSMQDIAKVNSNVEKWRSQDFINCYVNMGNENYIKLQNFINEFGFSNGVCLSLLSKGNPGDANGNLLNLTDDFQGGCFVVAFYEEAVKFANSVKLFKTFKNWRSRDFAFAIYKIINANKISIEEVAQAVAKNDGMIKEQATWKDYVMHLESIINVGKRTRLILT